MAGTTKSSTQTSMNVTGTNPENETNVGGDVTADVNVSRETDVNVDDVNLSAEDQRQQDVRARVQTISGIRIPNAQFTEGDDEESVEKFEAAYAKANPDAAPGTGRQYANAARGMGYTVKLGK